jgi:hypothetical protein
MERILKKILKVRVVSTESELLSEFHYNNKCLLLFVGSFHGSEFP